MVIFKAPTEHPYPFFEGCQFLWRILLRIDKVIKDWYSLRWKKIYRRPSPFIYNETSRKVLQMFLSSFQWIYEVSKLSTLCDENYRGSNLVNTTVVVWDKLTLICVISCTVLCFTTCTNIVHWVGNNIIDSCGKHTWHRPKKIWRIRRFLSIIINIEI